MVTETLKFVQHLNKQITIACIPIAYPIAGQAEIVESFVLELAKHAQVRMCIIDHVSSQVG